MDIHNFTLAASSLNLVAGIILIVAGGRGRADAAKAAKLMLALGVTVVATNVLWVIPDFVDGYTQTGTPTEPTHAGVMVHNASSNELKGVVIHFPDRDEPMFSISPNQGTLREMEMPLHRKLAVGWQDEDGVHRSSDLVVPPYPLRPRRDCDYRLRINLFSPHIQTVEWDEVWIPGFHHRR
jgi:hypothetical protein